MMGQNYSGEGKDVPVHAMKAYGGGGKVGYLFLTLELH
jgi:hypothetical protein